MQREQPEVYITVNAELQPDPVAFWLCQLPGMTATLLLQLLATVGSATAIMQLSSRALREQGVPPALVAKIVAGAREVPQVAAGLKGLQRLGIIPLPLAAPTYPQRLRDLQHPPMVVYVLGAWPVLEQLAVVVKPDAFTAESGAAWAELSRSALSQLALAAFEPEIAPDAPAPRLLGVPFGLLLARQRLAPNVWQQVVQGATTLLSTAPPTAQLHSALAAAAIPCLPATVVGLSRAVVVGTPHGAHAEPTLAAARSLGVPAFIWGLAPGAALPPNVRRLRPGKAGARALAAALGITKTGAITVQQERLF
ncbi:MAG: hypothetical protein M3R24_24330 [Chloroflexota bacterium]|nr:hypothetical protein [Chloroflexota bacterium]PLS83408.1 MAG: hypothetical protein CYG59_01285 [Chloroflexota bacterium]